uniref:RIIa domain-containing protein n=1 Tax=Heliothis virescens TaxID=7102 RepID=A0A2A4JIA7_HELVI
MPELIEQMYCSQQIVIPPKFPYILKRYCKAAIKTQPYDLLRWSFEYFKALAEHRAPPVKLRLEYPIYSTEGGLTRGCLKVLANQMYGMIEVPISIVKRAWQGFCLDHMELKRILCLCEVYRRQDSVPLLHFLAVAGGMLTKCLTHTMILLCESLTKEPDGGSAAIPMQDFLKMYRFLAQIDASKDIQYHNGYREGTAPPPAEPDTEERESHQQKKLKQLSATKMQDIGYAPPGEPSDETEVEEMIEADPDKVLEEGEEAAMVTKSEKLALFLCKTFEYRENRILDMEQTFAEIAAIVDKFKTANYDLGMVAGRQMSTTSGEFIVQTIEKEIMDYIDEQIAILPDPDLKKKKAKPEEVAMIRDILEQFLDDNMEIIVPEVEEVEEEETPIPEITMVYAVPGIGGPVEQDIMTDFEEFVREVCKLQADMVMPRNIRHFLCPPLEKYVEHDYSEYETPSKQEIPTGGAITD